MGGYERIYFDYGFIDVAPTFILYPSFIMVVFSGEAQKRRIAWR